MIEQSLPRLLGKDNLDPWARQLIDDLNVRLRALTQVRVTNADAQYGYLSSKIVAGANVTLAVLNPGGDEKLQVSASGGGSSDHGALTGLTPDDDHPQYLLLAGRPGTTNDPILSTTGAFGTLYGTAVGSGALKLRGSSNASVNELENIDALSKFRIVPVYTSAIGAGAVDFAFIYAGDSQTYQLADLSTTALMQSQCGLNLTGAIRTMRGVHLRSLITNNAGLTSDLGPYRAFNNDITYTPGTGSSMVLLRHFGVSDNVTYSNTGVSNTITRHYALNKACILGASWTATDWGLARLQVPTGGGAFVRFGGIEFDDPATIVASVSGGIYSLWAKGPGYFLAHEGSAIFGAAQATLTAPAASAILELSSATKALLLTRAAGTGGIVTPANGMLHYDSTANKVTARENGAWVTYLTAAEADALFLTPAEGNVYLLLAGRAGATNDPLISTGATGTIYGSDDASGVLKLQSTVNSARGTVDTPDRFRVHTDAITIPVNNYNAIELFSGGLTIGVTGRVHRGLYAGGTVTYASDTASPGAFFNNNMTLATDAAVRALTGSYNVYGNNLLVTPNAGGGMVLSEMQTLRHNPNFNNAGVNELHALAAVFCGGLVSAAWDIIDWRCVKMVEPTGTPAGLDRLGFAHLAALTKGTQNYSLWSEGASVFLAHAGPAVFGLAQGTLTAPSTGIAMDVAGALATRNPAATIVLALGVNDNVAISNYTYIRVTANAAGSSISSATGGVDGRWLIIYNTANVLTITHEAATGTAANRFHFPNGASFVSVGEGIAIFLYDTTLSRWLAVAGPIA